MKINEIESRKTIETMNQTKKKVSNNKNQECSMDNCMPKVKFLENHRFLELTEKEIAQLTNNN